MRSTPTYTPNGTRAGAGITPAHFWPYSHLDGVLLIPSRGGIPRQEVDLTTREVDIVVCHECGNICSDCNGSGEGMADGSTCRWCKGRGCTGLGEIFEPFTVEIDSDNKLTGGLECERCGENLREWAQIEIDEGRFSA